MPQRSGTVNSIRLRQRATAAELGVPFGRAVRDAAGVLVAGSGPGEWLLLAPPGEATAVAARLEGLAGNATGELVSVVDLTHGRALMRLTGPAAADALATVCGIDASDRFTPERHGVPLRGGGRGHRRDPRRRRGRPLLPAAL